MPVPVKHRKIAAFVDHPSPIPGLPRGQAGRADHLVAAFAADLPLRAIEHHFEGVFAELQGNIAEFVAPVAPVRVVRAQHPVAIEFGIPARRQGAAQGGRAEPRRQIERAVGDKGPATVAGLRAECRPRGFDIAQRNLSRAQRAQQGSVGIMAEQPHPQRLRRQPVLRGQPGGIAHPQHLAAGQRFVSQFRPMAARGPGLDLPIHRRPAPWPIGHDSPGQLPRIGAELIGAKSRRATFALQRFEEGQLVRALDHHGEIAQIAAQAHPQPARQRRQAGAPAFRGVDNLAGFQRTAFPHHGGGAGGAVDHQGALLGKHPAAQPAGRLVEPHRQVERLDHIGKVEADLLIGLVAA